VTAVVFNYCCQSEEYYQCAAEVNECRRCASAFAGTDSRSGVGSVAQFPVARDPLVGENPLLFFKGDFEGHSTVATLVRFDESKFLLRSRGFHWIQEYPFNR
jgi:hypothetical protein